MTNRTLILPMKEEDEQEVHKMMRVFYDSPAVLNKASDAILLRDIRDAYGENPFLEGYVFKEDAVTCGYAMIAKSYSTEYGGLCVWIEDLYIKPEYRGLGLGTRFFRYIEDQYKETAVRFRLEVEPENERAVRVYEKNGYTVLPYQEMTKESLREE